MAQAPDRTLGLYSLGVFGLGALRFLEVPGAGLELTKSITGPRESAEVIVVVDD